MGLKSFKFKDTCFKLNGYPNWYKELRHKKGPSGYKARVNMVDTPIDDEEMVGGLKKQEESVIKIFIREIIQEELSKILKEKSILNHNFVSYAQEFAGAIYDITPKDSC